MAVETFTENGNERIRKTESTTVTFGGKDWNVIHSVPKENYTVGENTDLTLAETDLDSGLYSIVNHIITNSYYLTESEMLTVCPNIEEITE